MQKYATYANFFGNRERIFAFHSLAPKVRRVVIEQTCLERSTEIDVSMQNPLVNETLHELWKFGYRRTSIVSFVWT